MTTYAVEAGRRAWETLPRLRLWLEEVRPARLLVPAIVVQWLTTLALALTVRHNGWLYYQGGDQLWYYVSGWLLAHGQIPVALLCIYGIAKRIGGKLFAYWAVALWLMVPFIGIKFTDYLYHQRYTELTLPQGFGLTAMADFPSMVAVLVCVYFALRVIERPDTVDALAAGLA